MVKHYSSDRVRYNRAYQALRKGWYIYPEQNPMGISQEIWDCAILTFDYFDSQFDGWINRQRYSKWRYRARTLQVLGEWPF